jgi:hypothetical protein
LIRPLYSILASSVADTITGWDGRTAWWMGNSSPTPIAVGYGSAIIDLGEAEPPRGMRAGRTLVSYQQGYESPVCAVARLRRFNNVGELRTSLLSPHRRPSRHLLVICGH